MSKVVAEIIDDVAPAAPETEPVRTSANLEETAPPATPKKRGQPADKVDVRKEKQRLLGVMKYYQAKDAYKALLAMPREETEKLASRAEVFSAATSKATPAKSADAVNVAELLGLAKEKAKRKKLKNEVRGLQALIAQALADDSPASPTPEPEPLRTATPPRSTSPADWFGLPVGTGELKPSSRRRR